MHQIGSRKRNQPAPPHIVFESLSLPARPTVGDVHAPHLVHWTSLWPSWLQIASFVWHAVRAWYIADDVDPHFATIGDPRVDTAWDGHSAAQPWESH